MELTLEINSCTILIFSQVKDFIKMELIKMLQYQIKVFLCNKHHSMLRKEKTEHTCLNLTKKHYSWYLKGFSNAAYWRTELHEMQT